MHTGTGQSAEGVHPGESTSFVHYVRSGVDSPNIANASRSLNPGNPNPFDTSRFATRIRFPLILYSLIGNRSTETFWEFWSESR